MFIYVAVKPKLIVTVFKFERPSFFMAWVGIGRKLYLVQCPQFKVNAMM